MTKFITSPEEPEIDAEAVIELAMRLIGASSVSGSEGNVASILSDALTNLGFAVETDECGNVIGTIDFGTGPTILFDAHLDTVPVSDGDRWTHSPCGELDAGRLYGRGAVDIKGPIAACVLGIASLRGRLNVGRVIFSATVAEELVEGPALVRVAKRVRPDAVVICEPSNCQLAIGQRGRAEITVVVHGRSCHSAYPEVGRNSVEAMADLITELRTVRLPVHPDLGPAILVLTDIVSRPYPSLSVVPDRCTATFDRRTLPGETERDVLDPIKLIADEVSAAHDVRIDVGVAIDDITTYTGFEMSVPNFAPAWINSRESHFVEAALQGLRLGGLSDEPKYYAFCTNGSGSAGTLGIPTLGFGPGREDAAHTTDEYIRLDDLLEGARGYSALASSLSALTHSEIWDNPNKEDPPELDF